MVSEQAGEGTYRIAKVYCNMDMVFWYSLFLLIGYIIDQYFYAIYWASTSAYMTCTV